MVQMRYQNYLRLSSEMVFVMCFICCHLMKMVGLFTPFCFSFLCACNGFSSCPCLTCLSRGHCMPFLFDCCCKVMFSRPTVGGSIFLLPLLAFLLFGHSWNLLFSFLSAMFFLPPLLALTFCSQGCILPLGNCACLHYGN